MLNFFERCLLFGTWEYSYSLHTSITDGRIHIPEYFCVYGKHGWGNSRIVFNICDFAEILNTLPKHKFYPCSSLFVTDEANRDFPFPTWSRQHQMSSSSRPPYHSSKSYDETDGKEAEKVSVLERLIRTHPVWFLPRLSREEAHEVLLGKHPGVSHNLHHSLLLPYWKNSCRFITRRALLLRGVIFENMFFRGFLQ